MSAKEGVGGAAASGGGSEKAGGAAFKNEKKKRKAPLSKSKSKMKLDMKTDLSGARRVHLEGSEGEGSGSVAVERKGARQLPATQTQAQGSDAAGDRSKRGYAGANQLMRGAQEGTAGQPAAHGAKSKMRVKHAHVATNGSLAKGTLLSSPVHPSRCTPIPHNLETLNPKPKTLNPEP